MELLIWYVGQKTEFSFWKNVRQPWTEVILHPHSGDAARQWLLNNTLRQVLRSEWLTLSLLKTFKSWSSRIVTAELSIKSHLWRRLYSTEWRRFPTRSEMQVAIVVISSLGLSRKFQDVLHKNPTAQWAVAGIISLSPDAQASRLYEHLYTSVFREVGSDDPVREYKIVLQSDLHKTAANEWPTFNFGNPYWQARVEPEISAPLPTNIFLPFCDDMRGTVPSPSVLLYSNFY